MVGTPCIASYAGGMMDSVSDGETGFLYRFEETEMLAMLVCRLFGDMDLCRRLSFRGRQASLERHDRSANAEPTEAHLRQHRRRGRERDGGT